MLLCAILTRKDLASAIEQITPLTVTLRRSVISLGRPSTVELVAGAGLRVRGDARFTWDAFGLAVPVSLRSWQVLLVPSFAERGGRNVLAFDPVLEALDFKSVPQFLDARITEAINEGLEAQKSVLAWEFEKHLSLVRCLPESVEPPREIRFGPSGGHVAVTDSEVRLTLDFELQVSVRRDLAVHARERRAKKDDLGRKVDPGRESKEAADDPVSGVAREPREVEREDSLQDREKHGGQHGAGRHVSERRP